MDLPEDLKHYRAPSDSQDGGDDGFQFLTPEAAIAWFLISMSLGYILGRFGQ